MKHRHISPVHSDPRGSITDIVENQSIQAATIITSRAGAIRGNHFHKLTVQYLYLLSGKILYRTRLISGEIVDTELNPGDLIVTEVLEEHAMKSLEESSFLVLTAGPRQGRQYELDTYRVESPLIAEQ